MDSSQALELADWRRQVAGLYSSVRQMDDHREAWEKWRTERDRLFRSHPQSPIPPEDRGPFKGLSYFDYDPALRFAVELLPAARRTYRIWSDEGENQTFERIGTVGFEIDRLQMSLEIYWIEGYAGGLFVPFRDEGADKSTYPGGRYVLDTAKGADLGMEEGGLVLDFNFAYQPSCAYDARWVCPLAPEANRLPVEVRAGEKHWA